jgi:ribosome recycling factor
VTHNDDLSAKANDLKATIKFQMKKVIDWLLNGINKIRTNTASAPELLDLVHHLAFHAVRLKLFLYAMSNWPNYVG